MPFEVELHRDVGVLGAQRVDQPRQKVLKIKGNN